MLRFLMVNQFLLYHNAMATTGKKQICAIYSIVFLCLTCVVRETKSEDVTTNVFDPLASFYIRQEAALRKLDALIVKVSQIDTLEAKLSDMTQLLENQQEKNLVLEAKLEAMEMKMGDMIDEIKQVNVSLAIVGASVCQVEGRLEYVSYGRAEDCQDVTSLIHNVTEMYRQMFEDYTVNLTTVCGVAMEEVKTFAEDAVINAASASLSKINESVSLTLEVQNRLSNLEDRMDSNTNITKHLFSATFSRIRVSNLAMDKRLGALLHTSSSRQRVLQDSLLTALTSVASLIKTQTQDVIRKTESRFGILELSLAASAKRHAKELASLVLETANHSFYDVSSSTKAQLEDLLQMHLNQSALLEDTLEVLKDSKNQSGQYIEDQNDLCILMVGNQTDNATLEYAGRSIRLLQDSINSMQSALSQQIATIAEQLIGMRIYYATSLHRNSNQMVSALGDVRTDVNRIVQDTLAKSTRHLEKLRRSSLAHLDAAVTSISSSAVASAQATSDQLKVAMKSLGVHIGDRLDKLQSTVSLLIVICPPKYTLVGNTCLMAFHDARTSWDTARDLCQQEEGDLALIPDSGMLVHLKAFLYATHSQDAFPPTPYWVGARKLEGQWVWTNGSTVALEVSETSKMADNLTEEVGDGALQDDECLMSSAAGVGLEPGHCESLKPVLCQYHPSQFSHTPQSTPTPEMPPQITYKPYVIIDSAFDNDLNSDTYDYMSYVLS